MTRKIVNARSSADGLSNGTPEENVYPSLTVPDMSIPLETLFQRFIRGGELPVGTYDESLPPGVEYLDTFERSDLLQDVRSNVANMQSELQSRAAERKRSKEESLISAVPTEPSI